MIIRVHYDNIIYVYILIYTHVSICMLCIITYMYNRSLLGFSLQKDLYYAATDQYWDGNEVEETVVPAWNFAGALLYSVTAITTIGKKVCVRVL